MVLWFKINVYFSTRGIPGEIQLTLTATCNLAVRLDGPEASNVVPSTSTAIVKTGTWTGPVWDTSLYCRPGFSWFSLIRAFIVWGGSAFSSGAGITTQRSTHTMSIFIDNSSVLSDAITSPLLLQMREDIDRRSVLNLSSVVWRKILLLEINIHLILGFVWSKKPARIQKQYLPKARASWKFRLYRWAINITDIHWRQQNPLNLQQNAEWLQYLKDFLDISWVP